jgi:hypothetical protein
MIFFKEMGAPIFIVFQKMSELVANVFGPVRRKADPAEF